MSQSYNPLYSHGGGRRFPDRNNEVELRAFLSQLWKELYIIGSAILKKNPHLQGLLQRDSHCLETAIGDTILSVLDNWEKCKVHPYFDGWLYKTLKNDLFDFRREITDLQLSNQPIDELLTVLNIEATVDDLGTMEDILSKLDSFLAKASLPRRQMFKLRFIQRLQYREIAEILEIDEEAAKKRGQRLKADLRMILKK